MKSPVAGKFRIGQKLGAGSFGEVYMGKNMHTGENVAMKFEPIRAKTPKLMYEAKVYKVLSGCFGIPSVHWYGVDGDYNVMVIDLLGPSLEDMFQSCGRELSRRTLLLLADQMIQRVESAHSRNFIHRDIKPENFTVGLDARYDEVHMIDFGLAKKYRDSKCNKHIPYREGKKLIGTPRYASINNHLGAEQSRRDDLESVGYVLVYLSLGKLPWQGILARSKQEKYRRISEKKQITPVEQLCGSLPPGFGQYIRYCRALGFEERPDYAFLRGLLKDCCFYHGHHLHGQLVSVGVAEEDLHEEKKQLEPDVLAKAIKTS